MLSLHHLEIRPGEGGDDAALFANELSDALSSYISGRDVQVSLRRGKTTILTLRGVIDPLHLEQFVGTHRIQRIPRNDSGGRRHTSTATVALVEDDQSQFDFKQDDLRIDYYRGHGKGGQHRNKTSSAVRVTHIPTGTMVAIERGRSQSQNLETAVGELRRRLTDQHAALATDATNRGRTNQISTGERPVKQWTWNSQRNEVLNHTTGERYRMSSCLRGNFGDYRWTRLTKE